MKKILIVDDDAINRKLLTTVLKNKGYEVIEANNGVEAISAIENHGNINLVLLDVLMPVMNGLEFLQNIRSKPEFMNIPIIVLTTDDTKKSEAINLGANDFLTKPINPTILLEKVEEY